MSKIDSKEIQMFYIAYFGRPADPPGVQYWLSQINLSLGLRKISKILSLQDEYLKFLAHEKSIENKINQFYLNLFGRKTDFNILKYWLNKVNNDHYQISDILYDLLFVMHSNNSLRSKQVAEDFSILENKIYAAELFTKKISMNSFLINLYQPISFNPWISGSPFDRATDFINQIALQKVLNKDVDFVIDSLSEKLNPKYTKMAIDMRSISLHIPLFSSENKSLTKKLTNKFLTGGRLNYTRKGKSVIALNKISVTIMNGERVALIGHNGSGKSSFLRLVSGIYQPTDGELKISVNVYPMLQKAFLVSSELTGIDACKAHYLLHNQNLIGFDNFLDGIIDFSGLGLYISLPIKTYSEGMSARLIFSILTSIHHDCLAIDEGFGTGDNDFFERAEERMKKFVDASGTLLFASHSEELLKKFCHRGLVFSQGSIVFDGLIDEALNYYHTYDYYKKNVI